MRGLQVAGSVLLASVLIAATAWSVAAQEVLGTVGTKSFTRADIEARVKPKLIEIEAQRYEVMREGLDEAIAEELFKLEAAARKITPEQLEKDEIAAKIPNPSDADIQKIYDDNKEELQGQSLEQVKPQIVEYIKEAGSAARRAAFIRELKAKYKTTDKLKAPTVEVATAALKDPDAGVRRAAVYVLAEVGSGGDTR